MSELSLVLLALGNKSGDVSENIIGIAAFAFAFLAIGSTYAILGSDSLLRKTTPWLNQLGLHDLDHTEFWGRRFEKPKRICLLGFSWTASSLIEEIHRNRPRLIAGDRASLISIRSSTNACASANFTPSMATSRNATCCITPARRTPKSSSARCPTWCSKARTI
jgi:hypothetical protein